MPTGAVVAIVIAVVVIGLAALVAAFALRGRHLRERFGPEYDRLRADHGGLRGWRAAEHELAGREKLHAQLDIQPVSATSRERHMQHWTLIQGRFVDHPSIAVDEADRLVITIMTECGYPTGDYEERLSVLSVEHAGILDSYRRASDIKHRHEESQLSTEALRTAMVHYRAVVEELLELRAAGKSLSGNGRSQEPQQV